MAREQIGTNVELPTGRPRRIEAGEKARQLAGRRGKTSLSTIRYRKVTGRVLPKQAEWLRDQVRRFGEKNPLKYKLTMDELMRVCIQHFMDSGDTEAIINKYRG